MNEWWESVVNKYTVLLRSKPYFIEWSLLLGKFSQLKIGSFAYKLPILFYLLVFIICLNLWFNFKTKYLYLQDAGNKQQAVHRHSSRYMWRSQAWVFPHIKIFLHFKNGYVREAIRHKLYFEVMTFHRKLIVDAGECLNTCAFLTSLFRFLLWFPVLMEARAWPPWWLILFLLPSFSLATAI